ncbi:hypothetical protein VTN77DRAFT_3815 [Rasamsonia byssochlamydoides]|uniref:uncharacterized protein n=1 Tax=Rasamsonia byssochlamydoides TaxID=89139 RepID=UPI0037427A2F
MEAQDGISVRPMRLKVLYTFDDEKTNCLARWPHLVDIQTAYLDEHTQIGVIELKTCIQAIVSASPELVAKLGQDYTVYAYDYSEYETPLVGQGMLSWVLASASPTPNAPAHQSRTIVTGRVRKNVLGLFSKGAQETLEVRLRLVPVPTVLQSEYLESMQKYRELSSIIPQDFDAQAWTTFVKQNASLFAPNNNRPQLTDRPNSSVDHSGIERFHQLLSESSTPREFQSVNRPDSPCQSPLPPPSRGSTPSGVRPPTQQPQQQQQQPQPQPHRRRESEASFRPSSRASTREPEPQRPTVVAARRGSMQSGYGSGEESMEQQPRKRAKLWRADWPGKEDLNIERQPGSLRVAASTAASVRIHRPIPVSSSTNTQSSNNNEEPVRPPTPISTDIPRRLRPGPSLLRESSNQSNTTYTSPYATGDERPSAEPAATSPDDTRYQGIFEPQFNMPSSPPIMDSGFPNRSSPALPPLPMQPDSGFMSTSLEDLLDDDGCLRTNIDEDAGTPLDECRRTHSNETSREERMADSAIQGTSPVKPPSVSGRQHDNFLASDGVFESTSKETAPPSLPPPRTTAASRPSSRASIRQPPKPLAPAPMSQSELEQLMNAIPASDPVLPPNGYLQHSNSWAGPMSDLPSVNTPAPQPVEEGGKVRSGAGARRVRQVQARLDQCIREGQIPPYCENCGAIETPTWRRAWSKEIDGSEQDANEFAKDAGMLFWQVLEKDEEDRVTRFKIYKKTLADTDNDFVQILLCNPCGLWLHKFKSMRPENKWNKQPPKDKRKRSSRNRKGPLSGGGAGAATRSRSKAQANKPAESSPGPTDASSPAGDDGVTPRVENDNEDDMQEPPSKRRRANSVEPRRTTDTVQSRWEEQDAIEALRRAIQSSPARNLESRNLEMNGNNLTPKPVRRTLFPSAHEGPLKTLNESLTNSPRRSPRITSRGSEKTAQEKENQAPATHDSLDDLFESTNFEFEPPATPTPKRRTPRAGTTTERRLSLPFSSPTARKGKDGNTDLTPARLAMEKLQRAQETVSEPTTPRRKNDKHDIPELPSIGGTPRSATQEMMNGIMMDIFNENSASGQPDSLYNFEPPKCPSGNWADWEPSDYVSPIESDAEDNNARHRHQNQHGEGHSNDCNSTEHDDSEAIIKALLSDPDVQKANMRASDFDSLLFGGGCSGLDSNGFGSDNGNSGLTGLGVTSSTSNSNSNQKEGEAEPSTSSTHDNSISS